MKDLYLMLDLEPDAQEAAIVERRESDHKVAAQCAILLDPDRRETYDRAYATMRAIGILRSRLGLDSGSSWFREEHPDFVPDMRSYRMHRKPEAAPQQPTTAAPLDTGRVTAIATEPVSASRDRWALFLTLAVVAVALAALTYYFAT